jgi:hypothetical protein
LALAWKSATKQLVMVSRRERPPAAKLVEAAERCAVFPHAWELVLRAIAAGLVSAV